MQTSNDKFHSNKGLAKLQTIYVLCQGKVSGFVNHVEKKKMMIAMIPSSLLTF